MSDATKPNLEPIGEEDLGLKEKFLGKKLEAKASAESPGELLSENPKIETPFLEIEKKERQEGAAEKESAYSKILSKIPNLAQTSDSPSIAADARDAHSQMDAESKIGHLVQLAETKGIAHAVKVARHLEDNYTLDEFHDRLLGEELHNALVKKGLIKEF